ncbi:hypothetical protein AXF42_Ash014862 [Apostasia shenzhenica]|uniref:Uncharacterized protein n=1 Tax=Apostasia shenzhenica TaxID=1088818 RepID=A0A2I0ALC2_9ASPA|nr:hypothetical protein AXF42_Ash014862 [Apostasia shenzhenica]
MTSIGRRLLLVLLLFLIPLVITTAISPVLIDTKMTPIDVNGVFASLVANFAIEVLDVMKHRRFVIATIMSMNAFATYANVGPRERILLVLLIESCLWVSLTIRILPLGTMPFDMSL